MTTSEKNKVRLVIILMALGRRGFLRNEFRRSGRRYLLCGAERK